MLQFQLLNNNKIELPRVVKYRITSDAETTRSPLTILQGHEDTFFLHVIKSYSRIVGIFVSNLYFCMIFILQYKLLYIVKYLYYVNKSVVIKKKVKIGSKAILCIQWQGSVRNMWLH
jgi:hypothetical protein